MDLAGNDTGANADDAAIRGAGAPPGAPPTMQPDRLTIALVAPYDLAQPGGVSRHIRDQARALRHRGHAVTVFGPASSHSELERGEVILDGAVTLNVGGTSSGLGLNPLAGREVRRIFRHNWFDVVHVHEPMTPMLPWLFLLNANPRAVRVGTFHVHREGRHPIYSRTSWLLRPLMARIDSRIAVSESARETVARSFSGEYDIIPNGIDLRSFNGTPGASDGTHAQTVLFLGRLEGRKGLPHLIRAMPLVREQFPDARLVVVGDGPDREASEQLARDTGGGVEFLGEITDTAAKARLLAAADVFCSPATGGESFGITLLEAMAARRAIVASAINGFRWLLDEGDAGLLVPPADPHALAGAIARLLGDASLRQQLGQRARALAEAYDWDSLAVQVEDLYFRARAKKQLTRV